MPHLRLTHKLPFAATKAWADFQSPKHLLRISAPFLSLRSANLPEKWSVGDPVFFQIYLFGFIPWSKHEIQFKAIEPNQHLLETVERGGAIRSWTHRFTIIPESERSCCCHDEIEFHAGAWNFPVWIYAQILYRFRYLRWRQN